MSEIIRVEHLNYVYNPGIVIQIFQMLSRMQQRLVLMLPVNVYETRRRFL